MAILKAPIELLSAYKRDPENFICDIANFPREAIVRFFRDPTAVYHAVKRSRVNPFDFDTSSLVEEYRCMEASNYYMHFDLSLGGDLCAFSMGHTTHFVQFSYIKNDGHVTEQVPYIYIDLVGILLVDKGDKVWLPKVMEIIRHLSEVGFDLNLITFDRFQSAYIMNLLSDEGYLTALLSIDRTSTFPYIDVNRDERFARKSTEGNYLEAMNSLKDSINQRRISIPYHRAMEANTSESEFEMEAKSAEHLVTKKKIQHSSSGRLDVLQAIAGVCYNIQNNEKTGIVQDQVLKANQDPFYQKHSHSRDQDEFNGVNRSPENEISYLG